MATDRVYAVCMKRNASPSAAIWLSCLSLVLCACFTFQATAQDADPADTGEFTVHQETTSVTYHVAEIAGEQVSYQATAGTLTLAELRGEHKPTAKIFYIAYRKVNNPPADGVDPTFPEASDRPITFSFNGGPGSSSVWLHLGVFGPKRVNAVDEFGNPGPPPYALVENEFSLLDKSDFVFIDPVATGYSRATEDGNPKDFHGVRADIESVAEFIRIYLGKTDRWGSPKYVAGESYGTTRAAGLVDELQDEHGIAINGTILISAILNFQTARFDVGNDLPYPLFLPTYAATAKFHEALEEPYQSMDLEDFLAEVEEFAMTEYTLALAQGDQLSNDQRRHIASKLNDYIGVGVEFALQTNLRVNMPRFPKQLLRDEGMTVGRLDSRYTGYDREDAGDSYEFDPSYVAIQSIYTESMNQYLRDDLEYRSDLRYEILTNVWPWSFRGVADNQYLNVAENLRQAMHRMQYMKVFIANGYYDLATPYFATQYTIDHMFLRPHIKENIEMHYYEAGHMMYAHLGMLEKLKNDLDAFYDAREE